MDGPKKGQADLRIPADYSLTKLKELMRAAVNDAYQRQDSEYLEHLSMLMLAIVKTTTSVRDAVVDGAETNIGRC